MKEIEFVVMVRPEGAPDVEVRAYRPPRRYSAAYKQRILAEYERLDRAGKGALLRREGLYNQLIAVWRKQRAIAVLSRQANASGLGRWRVAGRAAVGDGCWPAQMSLIGH